MGTVLERIVAAHRDAAAADERELGPLMEQAAAAPPPRRFRKSMGRWGLDVITEIKRRSPSKGELAPDLDPAGLAKAYEAGGAVALSVLTDREFFGGSPEDLVAARAAVNLPVLRKDFTVDERDVCDARIMGADAVLLIVAVLSDDELRRFHDLAHELGMAALVEVHDEAEVARAVVIHADMVGVNQRDLRTFEVDKGRAVRLARSIPSGVLKVAESGIGGADDLRRLADAGYDGALVGEHLVTAADPTETLRRLREGVR
ncbi:MAG TPA: indole-3-glycerol phosphate synthase TrpC [Acidimicrobiales bacterium]|nr:indole-3-glycerol phosphate synthase TrpC [Acidimicrobiales bacterium]